MCISNIQNTINRFFNFDNSSNMKRLSHSFTGSLNSMVWSCLFVSARHGFYYLPYVSLLLNSYLNVCVHTDEKVVFPCF